MLGYKYNQPIGIMVPHNSGGSMPRASHTTASAVPARMIQVEKGQHIYHEGGESACAYQMCVGTCILRKTGISGAHRGFGVVRAGEYFGDEVVLGIPRQHTAIAVTACVVFVLEKYDCRELLLAARRRDVIVENISMLSGVERLVFVLNNYEADFLTKKQIAALAWLDRATSSRLLDDITIIKDEAGKEIYRSKQRGHMNVIAPRLVG